MIYESSYWKEPLIKYAKRLETFKNRKRLIEKTMVDIERFIFIGFYSIRKLIEAEGKITDKTKNSKINIKKFRNIKSVDFLNKHKIDELYI